MAKTITRVLSSLVSSAGTLLPPFVVIDVELTGMFATDPLRAF